MEKSNCYRYEENIEMGQVVSIFKKGTRTSPKLFENQIEKSFLTTPELAKALNVSIHTIWSWRKYHIITPKKFGRSVRWLLNDVIEELAKRRKLK